MSARPPPRQPHTLGRLILALAVLLLGVAAAIRLPLSFLPARSFPELRVGLVLRESSTVEEVTRRHVVRLEQAVRSLGSVRGIAGEVDARGAILRVRLAARVDPRRKAAALESELNGLRRRLPEGSEVWVWPISENVGDRAAVLWIEGSGGAPDGQGSAEEPVDPALLDAVEALPAVRSVEVAGPPRQELQVVPRRSGTDLFRLARQLESALAVHRLGEAVVGERRRPLLRPAAAADLADLAVGDGAGGLVALRSLARVEWRREDPDWRFHLQGEPGRALLLQRELDSSPLELRRSLLRELERFGLAAGSRLVLDEAEPLRQLLVRLAAALVAAGLLAALLMAAAEGWAAGGVALLALPLALAGALNALLLADVPLDVTTLPALLVAAATGLLFHSLRWVEGDSRRVMGTAAVILLTGALLPAAVALAGGRLAPLLAAPARVYPLSCLGALVALLVLPSRPPEHRRRPPVWAAAQARRFLRNGTTALLLTITLAASIFTLAGRGLAPRLGRLTPPVGDITLRLTFSEGTTLAEATRRVAAIERHLDRMPAVEEHWSSFSKESGAVFLFVDRRWHPAPRLRALASRLRVELASVPVALAVVPLGAASGGGEEAERSFSDDLETRPRTDEEATSYRVVLRSRELAPLRRAETRLIERLAQLRLPRDRIRSEWGRPTPRLELEPLPWVGRERFEQASLAVGRSLRRPPSRPLPVEGEVALRLLDLAAPADEESWPQRSTLGAPRPESAELAAGLAPRSLLREREVAAAPRVRRESGRFALPMTIALTANAQGLREEWRRNYDRVLSRLPLPAGVELERPDLSPFVWEPERLELLGVGLVLPLLLLVLAVCSLDSVGRGLGALLPLGAGLAAATVGIRAGTGSADELTLLALGAGLCGVLPFALLIAPAAAGRPASTAARLHRFVATRLGPLGAGIAGALLLLVGAGLGLDPERQVWVMPLRAAGLLLGVGVGVALLVLPGVEYTLQEVRRLTPREARRRAHPSAWRELEPGDLVLSAHNLTKVYRGGVRALGQVDFRLEPGIVGLLGPNGAGKTTLLRLLCGLLEPSRGRVRLQGVVVDRFNLPRYRRLVGFLPQSFNAYEGLTAERFLDYWAIERGIADSRQRRSEVERVLELVGLGEAAGRAVRELSGGMRRRIGIARSLLGEPPVLIVDEPTTGLDVEARSRLRQSLLRAAGERIILFSTHIASDVQAAASRILVLDGGSLLFDGPAARLLEMARGQVVEMVVGDAELAELSRRYRVTTRVRSLEGLRIRVVVPGGEGLPGGELVEPNLEEAYLALTGRFERQLRGRDDHGYASLLDLTPRP